MNVFAGETMPDHVESAIKNLTDDADSNKDIYLSNIIKHCLLDYLNWKRISNLKILYINTAV